MDWIGDNGLIDMGFVGAKYTWMRGLHLSTLKRARLDRALCNVDLRSLYPDAKVVHLAQIQSDHAPLLICLDSQLRPMGLKQI